MVKSYKAEELINISETSSFVELNLLQRKRQAKMKKMF